MPKIITMKKSEYDRLQADNYRKQFLLILIVASEEKSDTLLPSCYLCGFDLA